MRKLGYVGTESPDTARWKELCTDVYGFEVDGLEDGTLRVRWDDRSYRLAVHPGGASRMSYLGWEIGHDETLASVSEALARHGLKNETGDADLCAARSVRELVAVEDPFGLRHEFFSGHNEPVGSWRGLRPTSGTVTGSLGLGHVVLVVPDMREALRFYRGVLGMTVSDVIHLGPPMGEMWFLRCNPRHHSIGLIQVPGHFGLQHIMVEARALHDVGIAWDRARERSLPFFMTLGQHAPDEMLSFYVRTPAGFDFEYGWGAVRVTDDQTWNPRYIDTRTGARNEVWGHEMELDGMPGTVHPISG